MNDNEWKKFLPSLNPIPGFDGLKPSLTRLVQGSKIDILERVKEQGEVTVVIITKDAYTLKEFPSIEENVKVNLKAGCNYIYLVPESLGDDSIFQRKISIFKNLDAAGDVDILSISADDPVSHMWEWVDSLMLIVKGNISKKKYKIGDLQREDIVDCFEQYYRPEDEFIGETSWLVCPETKLQTILGKYEKMSGSGAWY